MILFKEQFVERLSKEIRYHQSGNIQDLRNLWFQQREDEAKWVAQRIKSLVGTTYIEYNPDGTRKVDEGPIYSDFAVLIRSIRSHKGDNKDIQFVNAMMELDIPVKTSEKVVFLTDHMHNVYLQ